MIKKYVSTTSKNETYALVLMFNYGIHDKKHADMIQHKIICMFIYRVFLFLFFLFYANAA